MYIKGPRQEKGSILPIARIKADWEMALYSETEVKTPQDALRLVANRLVESPIEVSCAIFMNSGMLPICVATIGSGDKGSVFFDPRQIAQMGLLCDASMFILVHNHPDFVGFKNLNASPQDIEMTERTAKLCAPLGLYCYDSIVVNMNRQNQALHPAYYSIRNKKTLVLNRANGLQRGGVLSKDKFLDGNIPWLAEEDMNNVKSVWEENCFNGPIGMATNYQEMIAFHPDKDESEYDEL